MKVMITGHRPGAKLNDAKALLAMGQVLDDLMYEHDKDVTVISGGADGADRLWARAAYRRGLPIHLYVPRGYWKHYKAGEWAANLMWSAEEIFWTQELGEPFKPAYNFVRNIQMIEAADAHVACCYKPPSELILEKRGGTRHAVNEMVKRGIKPIWIDSLSGLIY